MLIVLLVSILIAWMIINFIFTRYWDKGISASAKFKDTYIYKGDSSALIETIVNDKHLPIPGIAIRLAISRYLEFTKESKKNSSVSDQTYKKDIFSFLNRQKIIRTLTFKGTKRGVYKINSLDVFAYNYFYKETSYITFPENSTMYVYPAQIDVSRINFICKDISGLILSLDRLHPDPFEFSGIREYTPNDPINKVNWKASARSNTLMVNQFDSTTNIDLIILLDIEDSKILRHDNLVEENISIASSLTGHLCKMKMPAKVLSNGTDFDTDRYLDWTMPVGCNDISYLNQKLSLISSEKIEYEFTDFLDEILNKNITNSIFTVVSHNYSDEIIDKIKKLTLLNNWVLWIITMDSGKKNHTLNIPNVKIINWEVS